MKLIYVSGPFSNGDEIHGIEQNIITASYYSLELWRTGKWAAICPHKNTKDYQWAKDVPYDVWIRGDLLMVEKCDAIFMLPGWEMSRGAKMEHEQAVALGLEVYYYDENPVGTF